MSTMAMGVFAGALVIVAGLAVAGFRRARRLQRLLDDERERAARQTTERERIAREQAVASERQRIYDDLHDDLGARLLGMIHGATSPVEADRARALLQDLRDVVTRSRGSAGSLDDVLGDIRAEATARLAAVGMALNWQTPDALPELPLEPERALHLYRIVREAISNVIRHARASRLRVRVALQSGELLLDLTDDGSGAGVAPAAHGTGRRAMQGRAAELDGDIVWTPGTEGGTKVLLRMPLDGGAA